MKHSLLLCLTLLAVLAGAPTACNRPQPATGHAAAPLAPSARAAQPAATQPQQTATAQQTAATPSTLSELLPAPLTHVPEQILERTAYTASYNKDTRQPNWVAWQLTPQHTDGSAQRKNYPFSADDDVPAPRAVPADYRHSGYDRGHMCPAADCRWSPRAMRESFLLTNVCPQNHNLNAGDWNELEAACRRWAQQLGTLYIVAGPVFLSSREPRTIGENGVRVPDAFFKVVLCLEGEPRGIGFIYRNEPGNRRRYAYANSIDQVERITGFDFFAALNDSLEQAVESQTDFERLWGVDGPVRQPTRR